MADYSRRQFLHIGFAGLAGWAFADPLAAAAALPNSQRRFNVLFIAVDDLRPSLGCYGDPVAVSPNIDRLARGGLVFLRAYCQQALCSPSRTSLLTGRRPDTTGIYDLRTHFRKTIPDVVTLPEQFKRHGYFTAGLSKIYHGGLDDPQSWSVPHWRPKRPGYGSPEARALLQRLRREARAKGIDIRNSRKAPKGLPWEAPDVADDALPDGATASHATELLEKIRDRPFFLAVGFLKPHLPFVAPRKYWDLYDPDKLPLADNPYPPKGAPRYALTNWGELRAYYGMPRKGPVSKEQARKLVHGYYACVSFCDAQVGRLLDALDRLGLRDNTVVVLWGDHGWHLGDHGFWCKHTNYERAVHSPLIISVPGQKTAGRKTDALVEFVDIYPSLCEICGLAPPRGLEGTSFVPLIENPDRPWKKAAFSQYPRHVRRRGRVMGYSMRTDRYRLVEWRFKDGSKEYELYDYKTDPDENVNIANRPENKDLLASLVKMLHEGWRGALPPGIEPH